MTKLELAEVSKVLVAKALNAWTAQHQDNPERVQAIQLARSIFGAPNVRIILLIDGITIEEIERGKPQ